MWGAAAAPAVRALAPAKAEGSITPLDGQKPQILLLHREVWSPSTPQVVFTTSKRISKLLAGITTQILMVLTALSTEAAPTESCLLAASPGACRAGAGYNCLAVQEAQSSLGGLQVPLTFIHAHDKAASSTSEQGAGGDTAPAVPRLRLLTRRSRPAQSWRRFYPLLTALGSSGCPEIPLPTVTW